MTDPNPLLGFARGDENAARHLQDRFRIIQERSRDPHIRALASKVLNGEAGPRDVLRDPAFGKFVAASVQRGMQQIKSLSDEDRRKLAEQGELEYQNIGLAKDAEPAQEERRVADPSWLDGGGFSEIDDGDFSDETWLEDG
ncbi:hypothetical protein AB0L13_13660 [Saccharopolyspora shandongensis]|uniref:hypothetical protein n=1 Tax=Saccharopolyspora shandongensis TaxID=418495 RepID=UPI003424381A